MARATVNTPSTPWQAAHAIVTSRARARARMSAAVTVQLAVGAPTAGRVIAQKYVTNTQIGIVQMPLLEPLDGVHLQKAVLFLMLDGECTVDWIRFDSNNRSTR